MANDLFEKSESQIEDIIYRQIKYKEKVLIEQKNGKEDIFNEWIFGC